MIPMYLSNFSGDDGIGLHLALNGGNHYLIFPRTAMVNNDSIAQENIRNPLELFNDKLGASFLTSEAGIQDVFFLL